jgi:hypothetical protein
MSRERPHRRFTIGDKKRLVRIAGEEASEAITDWVAVVKAELRGAGEIPILALALAELVRRYERAERSGMDDLAVVVRKRLIDCAAAVLKAEDVRSGSKRIDQGVIARPRGKANRNKLGKR